MTLLSIVIPTHRRPEQVARAIASAIEVHAGLDIEVLVVPNGDDDSWETVAERYGHDSRIRWLYFPTGNASAARNHGISHAQGEYVRFLDDDDHLLPAAADQLHLANLLNLDVCSAPLESIGPNGRCQGPITLPATDDFVVAAIRSVTISLTQGSIFRRKCIQDTPWREDVDLYDDYLWMLDLVGAGEASWTQTEAPVCAYVQHHGPRLSRIRRSGRNSRVLMSALLQTLEILKSQERITLERNSAIATAVLTQAHSAFPASPLYLSAMIRRATAIAEEARPLQPIFNAYPWLAKHPLALEWSMLAPRYVSRSYRRAIWSLGRMLQGLEKRVSALSGTHER